MAEYNEEFDRLRRNRVQVSYHKYGPAAKNFGEGRVDAYLTALRCLDAFERDHNLEHLLDAANYLMYRFSFPLPGDYFRATDSSGSVGTVGTPINMEKGGQCFELDHCVRGIRDYFYLIFGWLMAVR